MRCYYSTVQLRIQTPRVAPIQYLIYSTYQSRYSNIIIPAKVVPHPLLTCLNSEVSEANLIITSCFRSCNKIALRIISVSCNRYLTARVLHYFPSSTQPFRILSQPSCLPTSAYRRPTSGDVSSPTEWCFHINQVALVSLYLISIDAFTSTHPERTPRAHDG